MKSFFNLLSTHYFKQELRCIEAITILQIVISVQYTNSIWLKAWKMYKIGPWINNAFLGNLGSLISTITAFSS